MVVTNFEYYAKDRYNLETLLQTATDFALKAKGCSMKLEFPPEGDWGAWLESNVQELPKATPVITPSETADEYNQRLVIEKLEEILDSLSNIDTPCGMMLRDVIQEAIEQILLPY